MRVADLKPRITLREPASDPMQIIRQVAAINDVTMDQILGDSRRRPIAWARQHAYERLYRETRLSLPGIARIFKKDHTTVLYGILKHRKRKAEGKAI